MIRRPRHYMANGRRGLACPVLLAELETWRVARVPDNTDSPEAWRRADHRARKLYPLHTSDIRKTTCPTCWEAFRRLVWQHWGEGPYRKENDEHTD